MTRTQIKPSQVHIERATQRRVAALERGRNTTKLLDINTTALSSAQIDVQVFVGQQQAYDGAQISDSTNNLYLVRQGGQWAKISLTVIP